MQLQNVRFLNGGYCLQLKYFSGVKSAAWRRFYAVFVHFEHPTHGQCLIDTGYGPDIFSQTRRLPWRLMRWATPMPKHQAFAMPDYLASHDIDAKEIGHVFVSHFHADHIGATRLFPDSRFICRSEAHDQLQSLSTKRQLDNGFIPGLLPADFMDRSLPIHESQFSVDEQRFPHFASLDYWGDGSLILIDLPGHAIGHTGYLLNTDAGPKLYVVDAFWDREALVAQHRLPWLSRHILHSYRDYQATNESLRRIAAEHEWEPLACHCPLTQRYVQTTGH